MTINRTYARRFRQTLTAVAGLLLGLSAAHATETVIYYHTDALGTPVMESNAAGTVTYAREHKPYGEQALGAAKHGPGFTGHVGDADTGLTYMQARYFDPVASRFLSNDPVAADLSSGANYNRYWYANNNPYRFVDPDGLRVKPSGLCDWAGGCDGGSGGGGGGDSDSSTSEAVDADDGRYISGAIYLSRSDASDAASQHQTDIAGGKWQEHLFGTGYLTFIYKADGAFGYALQPYQGGIAPAFGGAGGVSSSRQLGRALQGAGFIKPVGSAAHHIVAGSARGAASARAILQRFGVGINEASNGVYLPKAAHQVLHTNAYYSAVNGALSGAQNRQQALQILQAIRRDLAAGRFP